MTPRKLADRMTFLHDVAMTHHGAAFWRGIAFGILALLGFVLRYALGGVASDVATIAGSLLALAFVYQFGRMLGFGLMASVIRATADRDATAGPLDDDTEWGPYR